MMGNNNNTKNIRGIRGKYKTKPKPPLINMIQYYRPSVCFNCDFKLNAHNSTSLATIAGYLQPDELEIQKLIPPSVFSSSIQNTPTTTDKNNKQPSSIILDTLAFIYKPELSPTDNPQNNKRLRRKLNLEACFLCENCGAHFTNLCRSRVKYLKLTRSRSNILNKLGLFNPDESSDDDEQEQNTANQAQVQHVQETQRTATTTTRTQVPTPGPNPATAILPVLIPPQKRNERKSPLKPKKFTIHDQVVACDLPQYDNNTSSSRQLQGRESATTQDEFMEAIDDDEFLAECKVEVVDDDDDDNNESIKYDDEDMMMDPNDNEQPDLDPDPPEDEEELDLFCSEEIPAPRDSSYDNNSHQNVPKRPRRVSTKVIIQDPLYLEPCRPTQVQDIDYALRLQQLLKPCKTRSPLQFLPRRARPGTPPRPAPSSTDKPAAAAANEADEPDSDPENSSTPTPNADSEIFCTNCYRYYPKNLASVPISTDPARKSIVTYKRHLKTCLLSHYSVRKQFETKDPALATICSICLNPRVNSYFLKQHLLSHANYKERIAALTCTTCGDEFKSIRTLERHEQILHAKTKPETSFKRKKTEEEETGVCPECGKVFRNVQGGVIAVKNHMELVHTKLTAYMCSICGKPNRSPFGLKRHMKTHLGLDERPRDYLCTECGASFYDNWTLNSHIAHRHEKTAPKTSFTCPKCNLSVACKRTFDRHVRGHVMDETGTYDVSCPLCPMKFKFESEYKNHGPDCPGQAHERPLVCLAEGCNKRFKRKPNLEIHLDEYHKFGPVKAREMVYPGLPPKEPKPKRKKKKVQKRTNRRGLIN